MSLDAHYRRIAQAQIEEQSRQRAKEEITYLNKEFAGKQYPFEFGGKELLAPFFHAVLVNDQDIPPAYQIELGAPDGVQVEGQVSITDRHGKQRGASASLRDHGSINILILECIALGENQ